ncbi:OmpA family protein [Reyranella sp.]|uniref:OmpA family protein n=1 Tax=Reyranella sp. TaxID=1929291 RepID=UPI003D146F89
MIKKVLAAAAAMVALPVLAQAQPLQYPGFYAGIEGGGNWMFNSTVTTWFGQPGTMYPQFGWAAGGMIGYDFVGPRVELEGIYRNNKSTMGSGNFNSFGVNKDDIAVMANLLYDFNAGGTIVPYIGAGAGIAFVRTSAFNIAQDTTQFAYQAIVGVGYNIDPMFRVNVDARYYGTTNPYLGGTGYTNNNLSAMLSLQVKFGAPPAVAPPPPPPAAAPSYMVFFDWDRSNLSQQALNTIKQAAGAYKTKGSARITATGHTDTSGPEAYNMALSLRRANTVKDALVREGVPATSIAVVGRGEQGLLVQTGDGVREPQNRRVEIVIQ